MKIFNESILYKSTLTKYSFEEIEFCQAVRIIDISLFDENLIFKNCTFHKGLELFSIINNYDTIITDCKISELRIDCSQLNGRFDLNGCDIEKLVFDGTVFRGAVNLYRNTISDFNCFDSKSRHDQSQFLGSLNIG